MKYMGSKNRIAKEILPIMLKERGQRIDSDMKEIINELKMSGLTLKQKAIVWYFTISFCSLCITDASPIWAIALVVLNFANAARLIRKVPLTDPENEE